MYRNPVSLHFQAFIPNRLTPHPLTELAGLSEDLLESYGDSWGFADEGVLIVGVLGEMEQKILTQIFYWINKEFRIV